MNELVHHLVYEDFMHSDNKSCAIRRVLAENIDLEEETNRFLCLLTEEERVCKPQTKRKEKEDDQVTEGEDDLNDVESPDPEYDLFIKFLKENDKAYAFVYDVDWCPVHIEYEEDSTSDEDCDPETRRELTNAMNGKSELPMVNVKMENVEYEEIVPSNYSLSFSPVDKIGDDHCSDIQILGSGPFSEENVNPLEDNFQSLSIWRMEDKFRQQVLNEMRKPYDVEEYIRFKYEIEIQKPEMRHMESRHGKGRRYSFNKLGKSHLDHHPDLREKLKEVEDDKRKCLKMLRGYFFWLQKMPHGEAFQPWRDPECLAVVEEAQ